MAKIGRNDPCPCGSGKKYKKCCLGRLRTRPWTFREVRGLSIEHILSKLADLGVDLAPEEFASEVESFYSAWDLAEHWRKTRPITAKGFDQDFLPMAATVLWERLAPHVMNTERLHDMMQEGYRLCDEGKEEEGCRIWLEVWEHLKRRFTPDMRSVADAERVFWGGHDLSNWCQDLEMELGNAGVKDPAFYEKRIVYCREFCALFPESDESIIENMKRAVAESLFALGRIEEGEKAFQDLVREFPRSAWAYIGWADMYWLWEESKAPRDYDRAEELYRLALERDLDEREEVLERLRMLEEERRREGA